MRYASSSHPVSGDKSAHGPHPSDSTAQGLGRPTGVGLRPLESNRHIRRAKIVVGKDTRLSGYMIEQAIASGICSAGLDFFSGFDAGECTGVASTVCLPNGELIDFAAAAVEMADP